MTKIKNTNAYPFKIPVAKDFVTGTDSESEENDTVSYKFEDIVSLINSINGSEIISYTFALSPVGELDENGYGYFLSENNEIVPTDITKLVFSKRTKSEIDLTEFFNFIDEHKNTFTVQLRNVSDPNNFIYLDITEIIEEEYQFTFTVSIYASDVYVGELINNNIYALDFNIKTDTDVLGKTLDGLDTSAGGSISDLDSVLSAFGKLQKQITDTYQPNVLITYTTPTRSVNTFTFPALGYTALINKAQYTNASAFVTNVNAATTDYKRTDLIYITTGGVVGKKIGTESLTVAVRPEVTSNEVAIAFINVFGNVIDNPIPVTTEISFQDAQGNEKFKVSDYVRFEGVDFDAPTKKIRVSPFTPFTVFVDTVNGNDSTGQIENKDKPFKTDTAAYNALPVNNETEWTLLYIDTGNIIRVMHQYPNRPIKIQCFSEGGTFDFSLLTGLATSTRNLTINIPRCDFNYVNSAETYIGSDLIFILYCRNMTLNASGGSPGSNGLLAGGFGSLIQCDHCTDLSGNQIIGLNGTFIVKGTLTLPNSGFLIGNAGRFSIIEVGTLIHNGTGEYSLFSANGVTGSFVIQNFSGNGTIYIANNYSRTMNINFVNTIIPPTMTLALGIGLDAPCNHYVTGTIESGNLSIGAGNEFNIYFQNFQGKILPFDATNVNVSIFNSTFFTDNEFMNGTSLAGLTISGTATFIQTNPGALITNLSSIKNILVNGFLKTNAKLVGLNTNVNYNALTFKERANEIVVRDKRDIINVALSSTTTYVIDANLVLLTGEYIQVPLGGLTLAGYGFDVSSISKNVSGQSIFTSPAGNSGNFITRDIMYAPGAGIVFNLTDSDGTHAIELNDVNFNGTAGSSLGVFSGYRQFTGTTCGFYSLSDGLTFEGNWSGFKLTNSNVIGFGSTGTLFKKGTSTVFSNRFYIDLNIQVATGSKICDFQNSNFTNDKSLQVVNCYIKVNGVINDTLTNVLFPNITPYSSKSYFLNNIGVKNSNNVPYGISTINMQTYADDTAAAVGGIVAIGDVYVVTSTGLLKVRQV